MKTIVVDDEKIALMTFMEEAKRTYLNLKSRDCLKMQRRQ